MLSLIKTYNIFISHSWTYDTQYNQLVNLLNNEPNFYYRNHSVPKDDPIHNASNSMMLRYAIQQEMAKAEVVLVLAGVYSTYSKWINEEISIAKSGFVFSKPIIAVEPFGSEKTSLVVKDNANMVVGWRGETIVKAIRHLAS